MKVLSRVDLNRPIMAILPQVLDCNTTLQVNEWHVTLHRRSVQCRRRHLPPSLTTLIPWRRANGEPLTRRHHRVESIKCWSRDERRLIGDP
jgi:hypothetical protein